MTFRSTKKLSCLALYLGKLLLNTLLYFSVSGCGSSALHILLNASFFLMVCAKRQEILWFLFLKYCSFVCHCFFNKPKRHLIPTHTLSHVKILRVIFSLFWFTIFILVSIQRTQGVLEKTQSNQEHAKTTAGHIFEKFVHCDM